MLRACVRVGVRKLTPTLCEKIFAEFERKHSTSSPPSSTVTRKFFRVARAHENFRYAFDTKFFVSPLRHTRKNFRVLTLCVRHATLRVTKLHTHAHAKKFRVCVCTRFASRDTRARNTLRVRHELYRQKIFTQPCKLVRIRKRALSEIAKFCTLRKVRKWAKAPKLGSGGHFP